MMMRIHLALMLFVAGAAPGLAQAPSATQHVPATRAAGSPLRDGAIPPGMLTVRVVRGSFSNNLANVNVLAEITGGTTETAKTGADGRAQFAHLPVGSMVHASATVDGETLTSETFEMPAEAGVRLLLVAEADGAASGLMAQGVAPVIPTATVAGPLPTGTAPVLAPAAPAQPLERGTQPEQDATPASVVAIRAVLATATVAVAIWILLRGTGRRRTATHG
jgi:hypothetical protein